MYLKYGTIGTPPSVSRSSWTIIWLDTIEERLRAVQPPFQGEYGAALAPAGDRQPLAFLAKPAQDD